MSSLSFLWPQVREMAVKSGIPDKPRAILREYLQIKTIDYLYSQKGSEKMSFIGGTSLRLLMNLPRFSEDLDFDNLGLSDKEVIKIVRQIVARFEVENIPVELFEKITEGKTYFELRFPNLLKELSISTNPREKLMIKIDYGRMWQDQKTRVMHMQRMGVSQSIVTNGLDQMLCEKLVAYAMRKMNQPRDMYDVVWLVAQGAKLDKEFLKQNKINNLSELVNQRLDKDGITREMKRKLAPFLFVPGDEQKLEMFRGVIEGLAF